MEGNFKTDKYQVVRGAVDIKVCEFICNEFHLLKNYLYIVNNADPNNQYKFSDADVPGSFAHYGPFCFETLLVMLQDKVSEVTEKELLPTYSYGRIYEPGAVLEKHTDRNSCEYSITLNIWNEKDPWDIWYTKETGEDVAVTLYPGDMIVYKGPDLLHWREPNITGQVMQCFLHYVDKNGEYKDFLFDKRRYLGFPTPWE